MFLKRFSARWLTATPNEIARAGKEKARRRVNGNRAKEAPIVEDLSQSNCVVNRPAESSVEAFRYLIRLNDPNKLRDWLAKRPPEEKAFFESYRDGSK